MARFNQWTQLLKASATSRRHDEKSDGVKQERYLLLDTAMGSENSGDHVIMDACGCIADQIFGAALPHVATHYYSKELEMYPEHVKLLCGTNILYTHMADQQQWALAKRLGNNRNVVLFGVGMSDIGVDDAIDAYTKKFYKTLLSDEYLHSVRDEMTKKRLNSIGIENVLNTACPTMWSLTPSKQLEISSKRSKNVVTSITDYCFDAERDRKMLELLSSEYEKVTIWVQGSHDVDWCLDQIADLTQFNVIGPNIEDLNRVIETEEFDYVGTRLHAGIRSYDPIRCQEPQWPRRPLAIGRRGLPLTRPGPPRHVIDAFGSVSYPRIPFCRPTLHSFGGVPQVCRGACGGLRAHSEIGGIPEGRPARRDGGYVYSAPSRHIMPRAQSHLTSSAAVAALAFAAGMPRASIPSRRRRSRSDPFLPCTLISRGTPVSLGMSFGWCRAAA